MRDFMATLAFSQGVPMLSHGDEIARTQGGNNNAYAQDNEISWVNWELDDRRQALLEFTKNVFAIRHAHPIFRRRHFFRGAPLKEGAPKDLMWVRPDGQEMTEQDWQNSHGRVLGALVNGDATPCSMTTPRRNVPATPPAISPAMPPATDRTTLSVRSWRTMRTGGSLVGGAGRAAT